MSEPTDEAFLAALLAGDLDPDREPARGRLAGDAALRARWDALADVRERLDAGSAAGRAVRAEAESSITASDVERTRRALEIARREPAVARPANRFRRWLVAAAALVCATIGVWLALRPREPAGTHATLETNAIVLVSPAGAWRAGEPLAWRYTLPEGGRYRVTFELAGPAAPERAERTVHVPQWIPTPEEFARLASPAAVTVEAQDASGQPQAVRRFSLSLSR